MSKIVPLVTYDKNGNRKIVGSALVAEEFDGDGAVKISDCIIEDIDLLKAMVSDSDYNTFSIKEEPTDG